MDEDQILAVTFLIAFIGLPSACLCVYFGRGATGELETPFISAV